MIVEVLSRFPGAQSFYTSAGTKNPNALRRWGFVFGRVLALLVPALSADKSSRVAFGVYLYRASATAPAVHEDVYDFARHHSTSQSCP